MNDEPTEVGPIDYLVVEFPGNHLTGEGLPILVDLVDRAIIRILDLVFVRTGQDGSITVLTIDDLAGVRDLAIFDGASSGLLGKEDIEQAATVLQSGSSAAILVYENRWAAPMVGALRRAGAEVVAGGRIPLADIESTLDS